MLHLPLQLSGRMLQPDNRCSANHTAFLLVRNKSCNKKKIKDSEKLRAKLTARQRRKPDTLGLHVEILTVSILRCCRQSMPQQRSLQSTCRLWAAF